MTTRPKYTEFENGREVMMELLWTTTSYSWTNYADNTDLELNYPDLARSKTERAVKKMDSAITELKEIDEGTTIEELREYVELYLIENGKRTPSTEDDDAVLENLMKLIETNMED